MCFACSCRCTHAVSVTRVRENRFLRTGQQATQKKIVANFLAVASWRRFVLKPFCERSPALNTRQFIHFESIAYSLLLFVHDGKKGIPKATCLTVFIISSEKIFHIDPTLCLIQQHYHNAFSELYHDEMGRGTTIELLLQLLGKPWASSLIHQGITLGQLWDRSTQLFNKQRVNQQRVPEWEDKFLLFTTSQKQD